MVVILVGKSEADRLRFSKIKGSIQTAHHIISTTWNACGILYLWSWTHTASGKKASYGYVYSDVAIVLF